MVCVGRNGFQAGVVAPLGALTPCTTPCSRRRSLRVAGSGCSLFAFRLSYCCSGTAWRATVQLIWHRLETDQQHWRCQSLTGRQPKVRGPHWHQGSGTLPMCVLPISAGGLGNRSKSVGLCMGTLEQARAVQAMSCDCMQGYYFSRPVAAVDIPLLLSRKWPTVDPGPPTGGRGHLTLVGRA